MEILTNTPTLDTWVKETKCLWCQAVLKVGGRDLYRRMQTRTTGIWFWKKEVSVRDEDYVYFTCPCCKGEGRFRLWPGNKAIPIMPEALSSQIY